MVTIATEVPAFIADQVQDLRARLSANGHTYESEDVVRMALAQGLETLAEMVANQEPRQRAS